MPRTKDIHVLVTEEERKTLQSEAEARGMSVSAYVRWIISQRTSIPMLKG